MTTEWLYRMFLFIPIADLTNTFKQAFVSILMRNGSREKMVDELKMFDDQNISKFSMSGNYPAQVHGFDIIVKDAMREEIITLLSTLPNAGCVTVLNTEESHDTIQSLASDAGLIEIMVDS